MNKNNYYLHKNNKTGEILYLEYDRIDGYPITPKKNIRDAIKVNKIVFVNPGLSEKLIRKKIEIKLRYLLKQLSELDDDSDSGDIRNTLMESERLKLDILNKYIKYLGNTYGSLTVKKVQVIINQLRIKLYNSINKKRLIEEELYYLDEEEYRGRGR